MAPLFRHFQWATFILHPVNKLQACSFDAAFVLSNSFGDLISFGLFSLRRLGSSLFGRNSTTGLFLFSRGLVECCVPLLLPRCLEWLLVGCLVFCSTDIVLGFHLFEI
jgi:hypothetical protein